MTETHLGHDLLCTALEGGIGYWARAYDIERVDGEYVSVTLVEWEDACIALDAPPFDNYQALDNAVSEGNPLVTLYPITADQLLDYFMDVATMPHNFPTLGLYASIWSTKYSEDNRYPDLDADDADVAVQMVLFGEIVYG